MKGTFSSWAQHTVAGGLLLLGVGCADSGSKSDHDRDDDDDSNEEAQACDAGASGCETEPFDNGDMANASDSGGGQDVPVSGDDAGSGDDATPGVDVGPANDSGFGTDAVSQDDTTISTDTGADFNAPDLPDSGPPPEYAEGVRVRLDSPFEGATTVSFGLPLIDETVADVSTLRLHSGGVSLAFDATPILFFRNPDGSPGGVRSVLIQFSAASLIGGSLEVDVSWSGEGTAPGSARVPFSNEGVSVASANRVATTERTIEEVGGSYALVEGPIEQVTLFDGREPRVQATIPADYLVATNLFGGLQTADQVLAGNQAGLEYLINAAPAAASAAMYDVGYAVDPRAVIIPNSENFEGWLYDRCATFLEVYVVSGGDSRFLRHALRTCAYYAGAIELEGENRGIFTGKPDPDTKYSHLRGLYFYYALTGDEAAVVAGTAIAELWLDDRSFVGPYREGYLREDGLWTERLLGTSLEGLIYGHWLLGDTIYLDALNEMIDTAYLHVTGSASDLAVINESNDFPPQNCFIHNAGQAGEGDSGEPWCSGWMTELVIDPLLRYQEQTDDDRIDEIFVRLGRFLRDTSTTYITDDVLGDSFLDPSVCYEPGSDEPRLLVPSYGSGLDGNGDRQLYAEFEDFEHCPDATALTAVAIRALVRQGGFNANPIGPFASEGASFVALHHELSACAEWDMGDHYRPGRRPDGWSGDELAPGVGDPAYFLEENRIGWPDYNVNPMRKLSWWLNNSLLEFSILDEAGVSFSSIEPGQVQPDGCQ